MSSLKTFFEVYTDPKNQFGPQPNINQTQLTSTQLKLNIHYRNSTLTSTQSQPHLIRSLNSASASNQPYPQINLSLKSTSPLNSTSTSVQPQT